MSENQAIVTGGLAALGAIGLAFFIYTQSTGGAMASDDGPGPNLVIDVAGEADGKIVIDLFPDVAPKHVAQIVSLANSGAYNNVVFHRVIDGFMAQTGDVQYGKMGDDLSRAGQGASDLPNIPAEFSEKPFLRGVVGMARSSDPDSANSQFFIMFAAGEFLNGEYTVVGHVVEGMEVVDKIKRGNADLNGVVEDPDLMTAVAVAP